MYSHEPNEENPEGVIGENPGILLGLAFPTSAEQLMIRSSQESACNGTRPWAEPLYSGATPLNGGWPVKVELKSLVYSEGPDALRMLWIPTHGSKDAQQIGPLVLFNDAPSRLETVAVGNLKADSKFLGLSVERTGNELLIVAANEECANVNEDEDCATIVKVMHPWDGKLRVLFSFVEVARGTKKVQEHGAYNGSRFAFESAAQFLPEGIAVHEFLTISDGSGRVLRNVERERLFRIEHGEAKSSESSLWDEKEFGSLGVD